MLPHENKPIEPKLLLFDVYETLLDMRQIERLVNQILDSKRGYIIWFELFMQYSFVDNCTTQFHDFISIANATLRMTHRILGREERTDRIEEILELMKHLPIREGVQQCLSDLHGQGYRIAALTNSPEKIVKERMERTGLISYFENVYSAEQVRKFKPARQVYEWVAEKLSLHTDEILLVSAHGWDIAGAENAGMQTAYMEYNRRLLYPLAPPPDFICKNLAELVLQLRSFFHR